MAQFSKDVLFVVHVPSQGAARQASRAKTVRRAGAAERRGCTARYFFRPLCPKAPRPLLLTHPLTDEQKDRAEARKQAEEAGEVVDEKAVFDSNCITPGTAFMAKVSAHLRYFIRKKQGEDPIWRRLHIVFSGHEVGGSAHLGVLEHAFSKLG